MKITISHHNEETICEFCGEPLYLGDPAIFADNEYFCSQRCATNHAHRAELNAAAITHLAKGDVQINELVDQAIAINSRYSD